MTGEMMRENQNRRTSAMDIEIGFRIRKIRQDKELSQSELADRIGVTYQQFQKYEQGKNRISAERLVQIATELGVTPHELLGYQDTDTANNDIDHLQSLCARVVKSRHKHLAIGLMQVIDDLSGLKNQAQLQHGKTIKKHSTAVE